MNNIRQAILQAADWIEKNPHEFNFSRVLIPKNKGCGTPGCALGWIGHFADICGDIGSNDFHTAHDVAIEMGLSIYGEGSACNNAANVFYERMDEIMIAWRHIPQHCAVTMRLYADKYHLTELPSGAEVCLAIMQKPFKESAHA